MKTTLIALLALGLCLPLAGAEKKKPLPKDFKSLKALAEKGNARAQGQLARNYTYGEGVKQNYVEALKWATLAARQGDDKGQGLLNQSKAIMESKVGDQVRIRVGEWRSISPPRGLLHMFGVQAR